MSTNPKQRFVTNAKCSKLMKMFVLLSTFTQKQSQWFDKSIAFAWVDDGIYLINNDNILGLIALWWLISISSFLQIILKIESNLSTKR